MQEALDMPWSEFVIKSFAFKERREYEMKMTREIAYQVYCNGFIFSKQKPKGKDKFWKIGAEKAPDNDIIKAFLEADRIYKQKTDGNS